MDASHDLLGPAGRAPANAPAVAAGVRQDVPLLDPDGHRLGEVVDVAIHWPSGALAYAIVAAGGLFGLGRRRRPVPFDLLRFDAQRGVFNTALAREDLVLAPELAAFELADWTDEALRERLYAHYGPLGARPYWA